MSAAPRCCPLCRQVAAQLDLSAVKFLTRQNKTAAILRLIRDVGAVGLTHEEVSKVTRFSHATVSARLHDLQRRNAIKAIGKRETDSGRKAWVFVVIDQECADTEQISAPVAESSPRLEEAPCES